MGERTEDQIPIHQVRRMLQERALDESKRAVRDFEYWRTQPIDKRPEWVRRMELAR